MFKQSLISQKFNIVGAEIFDPANVYARDFLNVALSVIAEDTAGGGYSVRVVGSYQETVPDFNSPSVDGNEWHYIQTKVVNTSTYNDGNTGLVISSDGTYALELNTDGQTFVALEVFDHTAGTGVAQFFFKDNT